MCSLPFLHDVGTCTRHVQGNLAIVQKALLRKMIIPEWEEFAALVRNMYRDVKNNTDGEVRYLIK